jgi:hypothetical protein
MSGSQRRGQLLAEVIILLSANLDRDRPLGLR